MEAKAPSPSGPAPSEGHSWWKPLDGYQRNVFVLASLAWLFDCLGQQVFVIARNPAVMDLMKAGGHPEKIGPATRRAFLCWDGPRGG